MTAPTALAAPVVGGVFAYRQVAAAARTAGALWARITYRQRATVASTTITKS